MQFFLFFNHTGNVSVPLFVSSSTFVLKFSELSSQEHSELECDIKLAYLDYESESEEGIDEEEDL